MKTKTPPAKNEPPVKFTGASARKNVHRVLVVDDHPIMRNGLAQLLEHENDLVICGQYEDAGNAFEAIGTLKPDVTIIDLSLKDSSGLELIKNVKASYPKLIILVLSMYDEALYAERVLRAGASGYVMKQEASEKVLVALRQVLNGGIYLSERMSSTFMRQLVGGAKNMAGGSLIERLSDRELEVFGLIGQGRGTRQIAEQLHLSVKTIESHRAHIKEKLNLSNATELVHRAIQMRAEQ